MEQETREKITTEHLERNAYLYVRQACRQRAETAEGIERQYALKERAVALGWKSARVVTIDDDLGQSGNSSRRPGFQRLLAQVRRADAGVVMALDTSRLGRRPSDWQLLAASCVLTRTLLLVAGRLLDPSCPEDRLLLGLVRGFLESAICRRSRASSRRGDLALERPALAVHGGSQDSWRRS